MSPLGIIFSQIYIYTVKCIFLKYLNCGKTFIALSLSIFHQINMPTRKKYSEPKPSPRTPDSLLNILNNGIVKIILDYSKSIDSYISKFLEKWQVDLEKRTPSPIYKESVNGYPEYCGTDIDLFGFFMGMSAGRYIANIPEYARRTPSVLRSDEWRLTGTPHGQVFGVISREDAHSFSIRIRDFDVMKVMKKESEMKHRIGLPRNIMVVDYTGRLYEGFEQVQLVATERQREILKKYGVRHEESERIFKGEPFVFTHFVFPALCKIFYSQHYFIPKILAERCDVEGDLHKKRAEYLRKQGIKLPPIEFISEDEEFAFKTDEIPSKIEHKKSPDKVEKIKVRNFSAKLLLPMKYPKDHRELPFISMEENGEIETYREWPADIRKLQGMLMYSERRANSMKWGIGARMKAIPRAVEYAMFLYGFKGERVPGNELLPDWSDGWQDWKRGSRAMAIADNVMLTYRIGECSIEQKEQELGEKKGIILEDMKLQ